MINVVIWSSNIIEIENQRYEIKDKFEMVQFIKNLLDKVYYSGETICLEEAIVDLEKAKTIYTEIERWHKVV